MRLLTAVLKRQWHCYWRTTLQVLQIAKDTHQAVDWHEGANVLPSVIACTCGRCFYVSDEVLRRARRVPLA